MVGEAMTPVFNLIPAWLIWQAFRRGRAPFLGRFMGWMSSCSRVVNVAYKFSAFRSHLLHLQDLILIHFFTINGFGICCYAFVLNLLLGMSILQWCCQVNLGSLQLLWNLTIKHSQISFIPERNKPSCCTDILGQQNQEIYQRAIQNLNLHLRNEMPNPAPDNILRRRWSALCQTLDNLLCFPKPWWAGGYLRGEASRSNIIDDVGLEKPLTHSKTARWRWHFRTDMGAWLAAAFLLLCKKDSASYLQLRLFFQFDNSGQELNSCFVVKSGQ